MARRNELDDRYAINAAKTELREGYNNTDVDRILSVFADMFTDMSDGQATFFGPDAKAVLSARLEKLFGEYQIEFTPILIAITIAGMVAVEYGWHELTLRPKPGSGGVKTHKVCAGVESRSTPVVAHRFGHR